MTFLYLFSSIVASCQYHMSQFPLNFLFFSLVFAESINSGRKLSHAHINAQSRRISFYYSTNKIYLNFFNDLDGRVCILAVYITRTFSFHSFYSTLYCVFPSVTHYYESFLLVSFISSSVVLLLIVLG